MKFCKISLNLTVQLYLSWQELTSKATALALGNNIKAVDWLNKAMASYSALGDKSKERQLRRQIFLIRGGVQ